jgi:hypothetical protein
MTAIASVSLTASGSGNVTTKFVCATGCGVGAGTVLPGIGVAGLELIGFWNNESVQACPTKTSMIDAVMMRRNNKVEFLFILSP